MLALRETDIGFSTWLAGAHLSDIPHSKNDNFLRYFPLGNIRIFVTKFFVTDTFCSGRSGGLLRGPKERNVGTVTPVAVHL